MGQGIQKSDWDQLEGRWSQGFLGSKQKHAYKVVVDDVLLPFHDTACYGFDPGAGRVNRNSFQQRQQDFR